MGSVPSTLAQVMLFIAVVLPGVTYQFVRERWRGPVPGEADPSHRVLRAATASVVLDGCYLIAFGPQLAPIYHTGDLSAHPRLVGVFTVLLLFAVPAAAALAVSWLQRRRLRSRYRPVATAWDHTFRDRGPSFVRARLKDGSWVGGWYGSRSYASSYPQAPDLYLESTWRMDRDGAFDARLAQTSGTYLRCADVDVIELLDPPQQSAPTERKPSR